MNQLHRLLLFFLFLPTLAYSQESDWFSLGRFSLSISSGYHINPWKNYNQAVESAARNISANPRFIEPRGYYETVQGIGMLDGVASYRLFERFQILLGGSYGEIEAGVEFYPEPALLPSDRRSLAFHQQLSYHQQAYGIGAQYEFPLQGGVLLTASTMIEYYRGDLELRWRYNRFATGPLPENGGENLLSDLSASTIGATLTGGAQYHVWGPVSITGQVRYRIATLKDFEGPATYKPVPEFQRSFPAELVEASNFFGVRVKEQSDDPTMQVYLPEFTFLALPGESARVPATVKLSSFGFTGGVVITF